MIRIVTSGTLTALRRNADLLPGYRQREDEHLAVIEALHQDLAQERATAERLRAENESYAAAATGPDAALWAIAAHPTTVGLATAANPTVVVEALFEAYGDRAASIVERAAARALAAAIDSIPDDDNSPEAIHFRGLGRMLAASGRFQARREAAASV